MIVDDAKGWESMVRSLRAAVPQPVRRGIRLAKRIASFLPRQLIGTVTYVKTDVPAVAFTFDDGPNPAVTPSVLETLEAHGARGTFFLVGRSVQRYPDLVQRIVAGGHAIGNHSWDHVSFPAISARERRRQLRECGRSLGEGHARIFRPPFGNQTWLSRLDPLWLGWTVVTWNICGNDWHGESADMIANRILESLKSGSIVLLHDRLDSYETAEYASRVATLEALRRVLVACEDRYRFVTVPELLRLGHPNRELWIQPGQADYLAALKSGET